MCQHPEQFVFVIRDSQDCCTMRTQNCTLLSHMMVLFHLQPVRWLVYGLISLAGASLL